MALTAGKERPSAEGVVSGFVNSGTVDLLVDAINQVAVTALASDLLAFWPPAKPPFILALFEDRAALDRASGRLAGIAATGATVVVGLPGSPANLPPGLYGVDLRGSDDLVDARAFVVLEGSFAAALVVVRSDVVVPSGSDEEPSHLYNARWTFRRPRVIDAMQQLLRPLRPVLAAGLVEAADAALVRAAEISTTDGESHLLGVLEMISTGLVSAPVLTPVVAPTLSAEQKRPRIVRDE